MIPPNQYSRATRRGEQFASRPRLADITGVDWIKGGSLERMSIIRDVPGGARECIVRIPSDADLVGQCDGCEKRHSVINVACSRNQKRATWATRPGAIYDFKTRTLLAARPVKLDETWGPFPIGIETWKL